VTDTELQNWWPDLGTVVAALRQAGRGDCGVLRDARILRSRLDEPARPAWDAVMADVRRASPGSALGHWLGRLWPRRG
jgi:hypothetical protein